MHDFARAKRIVVASTSATSSATTATKQQQQQQELGQLVAFPLPPSKKYKLQPLDFQQKSTTVSHHHSSSAGGVSHGAGNGAGTGGSSGSNGIGKSNTATSVLTARGSGGGEKGPIDVPHSLTVACIHFKRALEIELFWLESCKALADLTNLPSIFASQYSFFCLEVHIVRLR